MEVSQIKTTHDWIVFLYIHERKYSNKFALGMELAMASHRDGINKLRLRTHGFFKHPDPTADMQQAQGYDYGCMIVEELEKLNPDLVRSLIRAFPAQCLAPTHAL
jgi:hypothetical protein